MSCLNNERIQLPEGYRCVQEIYLSRLLAQQEVKRVHLFEIVGPLKVVHPKGPLAQQEGERGHLLKVPKVLEVLRLIRLLVRQRAERVLPLLEMRGPIKVVNPKGPLARQEADRTHQLKLHKSVEALFLKGSQRVHLAHFSQALGLPVQGNVSMILHQLLPRR